MCILLELITENVRIDLVDSVPDRGDFIFHHCWFDALPVFPPDAYA